MLKAVLTLMLMKILLLVSTRTLPKCVWILFHKINVNNQGLIKNPVTIYQIKDNNVIGMKIRNSANVVKKMKNYKTA